MGTIVKILGAYWFLKVLIGILLIVGVIYLIKKGRNAR